MKILLLGANGQVGREMIRLIGSNKTHEIIAYDRKALDLSQYQGDTDILMQGFGTAPDAIINAAAYTQVDSAESDGTTADTINGTAVGHLYKAAEMMGSVLVHYSTDYVFGDAARNTPYKESDAPSPINRYGKSKLMGEQACGDNSLIIRTSWVHSPYGQNFIKSMLRLMREKERLDIVSDQCGTPTSARLIAEMTLALLEAEARGLYHVTADGETDWYHYAQFIHNTASEAGYPMAVKTIDPISTDDYPTEAMRPAYSVLDNGKLQAIIGESLPDWQIGAKQTIQELLENG